MVEATVKFILESSEIIIIQCSKEDKMKDICNKFSLKTNINLNSYIFLYGGKLLNFESSFKDQANSIDNNNGEMSILVYKKENEELYCDKCYKIFKLNTEKIEQIILSYCNIKEEIYAIQLQIKNMINNSLADSMNIQLKNINISLDYINKDILKNNQILGKLLREVNNNINLQDKYSIQNNYNNINENISKISKYVELRETGCDLKLEDALDLSSYPKDNLNFIKNFLQMNYSNNDMANVFLTLENNELIFLIKYFLKIKLFNKYYAVSLLVYIPTLFPNHPPEFFIEKKLGVHINKWYTNNQFISNNFKININYFKDFDPFEIDMGKIINSIIDNFNIRFPIYQNKNDINDSLDNLGKCVFEGKKVTRIIILKD